MADFGVYWAFYSKTDEPDWVNGWRIGLRSRLQNTEQGDRLWLFSSGKKCKKGGFEKDADGRALKDHLGYLLELFIATKPKPEKSGRFTHLIKAQRHFQFNPPILVDDVFRAEQSNKKLPIGTVRQSIWQFSAFQKEQVKSLLSRDYPDVAALL